MQNVNTLTVTILVSLESSIDLPKILRCEPNPISYSGMSQNLSEVRVAGSTGSG